MKHLLITDTHLGLYSDSDMWLNVVQNFFHDMFEFCVDNEIESIIHAGDFFHNRKSLNTKTQAIAHNIARESYDLSFKIIVGNHDCYFKNRIHPHTLQLFEKYENIEIIDEPKVYDGIMLMPWGCIAGDEFYAEGSADYLIGHFAINGFHMNDSYKCKDGLPGATFKSFKKVLSGHFHTPSSKGNITYLGSPYGQTFHDLDERGFYTFEYGKLDFHVYDKAPKFIKIYTEDLKLDNVKNNIVRIIFEKDYGTNGNQEIVDKVLAKEPLLYSMKYASKEQDEVEIEDAKMESREQIADQFIDAQTFPTNIKVPTLKTMFKKLMKEASE